MAASPSAPDQRRRQQRRRALVGWLGGIAAVAVLIVLAAGGGSGGESHRQPFEAPYGELMTSLEYKDIHEGESEEAVLGRLERSGRPESLTKSYVLVLFQRPEAGTECTYWEFSDEPQIFAQLCFDADSGELVSKADGNVHEGLKEEEEGRITA